MPRFRTGHRVKLNVYDGDEPAFQAHSEHKAAVYVALLNAGERVETITRAELHELFDRSEQWWDEEDFLGRLERAVWHLFTSPETPPSVPIDPMLWVHERRLPVAPETPPNSPESAPEAPEGPRVEKWAIEGIANRLIDGWLPHAADEPGGDPYWVTTYGGSEPMAGDQRAILEKLEWV